MKVGIIGYGTEGKAAYTHWTSKRAAVTVLDASPDAAVPAGVKAELGPAYLDNLDQFDLLVRSPGVKPELLETRTPVTTATREFFAECPAPIIGVTGTKGKGTTSSLITEILKAAGKRVWLGGNIGRAGLEFLSDVRPEHWVVLELSSYQLVDLDRSPHIGVCLMIVPEHVEWHGGMDEYVGGKRAIAQYQKANDTLVYHAHNQYSRQIAELSVGHKVPYLEAPGAQVRDGQIVISGQVICRTDEVGLVGPHNLENICAAVTAAWEVVGHDVAAIAQAVKSFKGLPNRIETIGVVDGVKWVNDTYSVNPSATEAAAASFSEPKVMIVGGLARGLDYDGMAKVVAASNVRAAIVIGQTGPEIGELLAKHGLRQVIAGAKTMPEIVKQAAEVAKPGDAVILSPGCASYDMFTNYIERGRQFVEAVRSLEGAR